MKEKICKYDAKGLCRFGAQCLLKHTPKAPKFRSRLYVPGAIRPAMYGFGGGRLGGIRDYDEDLYEGDGEQIDIGGEEDEEIKGDFSELKTNIGKMY